MGIATFDYAVWALRYPQLAAKVPEPLATLYFGEACDFLNNTDLSPVEDVAQRTRFLYLLTAHIAAINGATEAGAAGLVGRISSVTEGSVTIATEGFGAGGQTAAWFNQTTWGAQYWALTAPYRAFTYIPGPQPFLGVPGDQRWPN